MSKTASLKQISELDRVAMEDAGLDILQMMEMAGNKFALVVKNHFGNLKDKNILVLSGTGHNGGDGLSAARYLANWGAKVNVIVAKDEVKPAVTHQRKILEKMEIPISVNPSNFPQADLIIDALLGYSLQGDPKTPYADLINKANKSQSTIFAFDNPSGLNIETGTESNPTIKASSTITLAVIKKGLVQENAKNYVGNLFLTDLGIPKWAYEESGLDYPFQNLEHNFLI